MVSSTLCPAVHILGSQNVYGRAEGIADHYWPWAVFFSHEVILKEDVSFSYNSTLWSSRSLREIYHEYIGCCACTCAWVCVTD